MKEQYYLWEEVLCPIGRHSVTTYHLRSVWEDMDEMVFTDLISLADYAMVSCKDIDSVVIYYGVDNRVEGKPHVEVYSKGTTLVRGITCKDSLLSRLNDEILTILEEKAKES